MVNAKMKFANCLLNSNDFSSGHTSHTHHTKPGRMASIFLRRPRRDSLHTGRDAPFALQLTAGSITLQVINTIYLPFFSKFSKTSITAVLSSWSKFSKFVNSVFGKVYFTHQNKNLHFAPPRVFLGADLILSY